jgi:asparagine synthase (glutamine-hydrolysing)
VFEAEDFNHLPLVVRHLQAPQCSATSLPLFLLYRACHEAGFKVVMTGEGADELLGGYYWFDGDRRVRPLLRAPRLLRALLARLPLPVSAGGRRVLARGGGVPAARYALWQETGPPVQRRALLQVGGAPPIHQHWRSQFGEDLNGRHPLDQFVLLDAQTRLVDFINLEVDRMSMAHSVEARPPFLDHHLWELCATFPPPLKLGPAGNKLLLRRAMVSRLPEVVRQRPKQGLATPHASWWRRERLPHWAEEALHPAALLQTGLFHAPTVARLRREHQRGVADYSRLLMGVLTTQVWWDVMGVKD